jgi:hypothetical protein
VHWAGAACVRPALSAPSVTITRTHCTTNTRARRTPHAARLS